MMGLRALKAVGGIVCKWDRGGRVVFLFVSSFDLLLASICQMFMLKKESMIHLLQICEVVFYILLKSLELAVLLLEIALVQVKCWK